MSSCPGSGFFLGAGANEGFFKTEHRRGLQDQFGRRGALVKPVPELA